jgi:hypothetical protein
VCAQAVWGRGGLLRGFEGGGRRPRKKKGNEAAAAAAAARRRTRLCRPARAASAQKQACASSARTRLPHSTEHPKPTSAHVASRSTPSETSVPIRSPRAPGLARGYRARARAAARFSCLSQSARAAPRLQSRPADVGMGQVISAPPGQPPRSAGHVTHHTVDLPRRAAGAPPSFASSSSRDQHHHQQQQLVAPGARLPPGPPSLLALCVAAVATRAADLEDGLSALPPDLAQLVVDRLAATGESARGRRPATPRRRRRPRPSRSAASPLSLSPPLSLPALKTPASSLPSPP